MNRSPGYYGLLDCIDEALKEQSMLVLSKGFRY